MKQKVAIITGSATGIGKRTAMALAKAGNHVVINYVHSQKAAEETADFIRQTYAVQALVVQADVSRYADVQKLVSQTLATFSRIDILVHNAGPFIKEQKPLRDYWVNEWQAMVNGNVNGCVY